MRYHTAAHVISGMLSKELNCLITGNQLETDYGRIDFSWDDYSFEKAKEFIAKANEIIGRDLPIKIYSLKRAEALGDPNIFKLAKAFPEHIQDIRIVDIVGFDRQADGGCHVRSLGEIGKLEFMRCDNKGKNNRRVYFKIV